MGIHHKGRIQPGQRVLINGAGGGAGAFAMQLAKSAGAEVTGVDSSGKLDMMRSMDADYVIDYAREDFTRIGQSHDLILDLAGHHSVFDYRRALSPRGTYLMVGGTVPLLLRVLLLGTCISMLGNRKMSLLAAHQN